MTDNYDKMSYMPATNVQLRRLAAELRRLREAAGLTHDEVRQATHMSRAALSRIENAQGRPQLKSLMSLLDAYKASDDERDALLELHTSAGQAQSGWLARYTDGLPGEYPALIQFESEATNKSEWNGQAVPGLLQTPDYARAVVKAGAPNLSPEAVHKRVETRMTRQHLLRKPKPLKVRAVIAEEVLRRPVGGYAVMNAQLRHLAEVSSLPNVTVHVLPESVGAHAGMSGAFSVLDFAKAPSAVYLEHIGGDVFLDDADDVEQFAATFARLRRSALDPDESAQLILSVADHQARRADS